MFGPEFKKYFLVSRDLKIIFPNLPIKKKKSCTEFKIYLVQTKRPIIIKNKRVEWPNGPIQWAVCTHYPYGPIKLLVRKSRKTLKRGGNRETLIRREEKRRLRVRV